MHGVAMSAFYISCTYLQNMVEEFSNKQQLKPRVIIFHHDDVAQGVALTNVTLINPFYIGRNEGNFYVCLGGKFVKQIFRNLNSLFINKQWISKNFL
jgi:hypothetical protein